MHYCGRSPEEGTGFEGVYCIELTVDEGSDSFRGCIMYYSESWKEEQRVKRVFNAFLGQKTRGNDNLGVSIMHYCEC